MGQPGKPKVLLLELIPETPFRHYRAETFPFIVGMCEAAGVVCAWSALGVPEDPSYDYRLDPADLAVMVAQVRRHEPTLVLMNEHLVAEQLGQLEAAFPGTSFLLRDRSNLAELREFLLEVLEIDAPQTWHGEDWLDRVIPCYRRTPANPLARTLQPFVHVLAGPRCVYRRPLAGNPAYQDVDIAGCHDGCAFCGRDWTPYRVGSFVDFAVRQVVQADRDLDPASQPLSLDVHSAAVWQGLEEFVGRLHDAGVRPFLLYLSPRLDELLAAGEVLDRLLPLLAARGDGIRLYTSGVESFSEGENQRLNKGLGGAQIQAATARILGWRDIWPETLDFAEAQGLSAILFTPWTTLVDVSENLRHLIGNPLISADYALGTRLLLFPGRAVTRLAQRDGLLAEAFDDHAGEAGCRIEWDREELPWRFQRPEVALLYRLVRRLSPEGRVPTDDPDLVRVTAWRAGLPAAARDIRTLTAHACTVLGAAPETRDLRALVASIHPRLDLAIPFRWPGEGGRILLDGRWRDRVQGALHSVRRNRPGLLSGARLGECVLTRSSGAPALRLEFLGPGDVGLLLWMQDADLEIRSFLKNDAVAMWIDGTTPLQAPWMEDVVRLVARVGERLASPQKLTSDRGARPRRPGSRSGE